MCLAPPGYAVIKKSNLRRPVQLESMDFGALLGDVVPRDGLQRPVLTSGSPVRARAGRRAPAQPTHVTHVHQNVFQTFGNHPVAVETTAADGSSGLSQLERALHVSSGSIHPPASKWRHRSKAMVAAGVPAHGHDGVMECGSMLPMPLPHAALPAETCQVPVLTIEHVPQPVVVPLTPHADPGPRRAADAIARMTALAKSHSLVVIHQPQVQCERTACGGHASAAIARMAAEAEAASQSERRHAQATRDKCSATARLLQRAGRYEQAEQVMAAAPALPPMAAQPEGGLVLLHPPAIASSALASSGPCRPPPLTWNGSVVACSSLVPPPPGSTLTPVQVAVEGVAWLPPGERRARVASLAAAARIVPFMSMEQVNSLLGRPQGLVMVGDAMAYVTASAIHTIGFGWAAGTIDGARRTWMRMLAFAQRTNAMAGLAEFHFWGYIVSRFLSAVDSDARAKYKHRHPNKPRHVMDAKGAAARGGQAAACLFLARNLTFPIQVECKAVTLVVKAARRRTSRQAPALGPRMVYILCWLTEHGTSEHVRCHAAGWLALVHFALRLINAQRACIHSMVGDVVRGSCDLDAKISAGEQNGRPMWAHRYDMRGSDMWVHLLVLMRDAPPRAPSLYNPSAGLEDPHYFLRDTNSSDGNPAGATAWVDSPLAGRRATISLQSLAQLSPWALPAEVALEKTGHSAKHDLNCVSRSGGDPVSDTNEIGKWSGSLAQSADVATASSAAAMHTRHGAGSSEQDSSMPDLYSSEAVEEIVPAIMQRQIRRLQALLVSPGIDALPAKGGWKYIPRDGTSTQAVVVSHVAPAPNSANADLRPTAQPAIARAATLALPPVPPPPPSAASSSCNAQIPQSQRTAQIPQSHPTPIPVSGSGARDSIPRCKRMSHSLVSTAPHTPSAQQGRAPSPVHVTVASLPSGRTRSRHYIA